jgi:hypothetical protein
LLDRFSWELIHNKGYQKFDTVSSTVTTKVKGQGFVPVHRQFESNVNKSDPNYYDRLFMLDPNITYKILDTAGISFQTKTERKTFLLN